MIRVIRKERLKEAEMTPMTDTTNPVEMPVAEPAAPSEVAQAATDNLTIPEGTEGALVGEDSTVNPQNNVPGAEDAAEDNGYVTATAEILIPSEALNRAGAMETGDTGDPVDTMPNPVAPTVEAPQGAVVTDVENISANDLQPTVESTDEENHEDLDAIKESLTEDDLRMILEYRKYKENPEVETLKESNEEEDPEKIDAISPEPLPEPEPLDEPDPRPDEPTENTSQEKHLNFDDLEVDDSEVDDVFNDSSLDPEDLDRLLGEDDVVDPNELEDFLDGDIAVEDVPDALRTSADFLDYVLSDREETNPEDDEEQKDEEEKGALDFNDITMGPGEEDDNIDNEVAEHEDLYEETDELDENYVSYSKRFSEAASNNGIWYPPTEEDSEIKRSRNTEDEFNLIRDYQNHVREQKKALSDFRNSLKENKSKNAAETRKASSDNRFNEALKGSSRSSKLSEKTDSWANNTFIEKYNESKKLDFKKLLEDGFLG